MPRLAKPLTNREIESAIQNARRTKKVRWLTDGGGLSLKIEASGHAKYWLRYRHPTQKDQRYRELGEHSTSFGLADARKAAAAERDLLRQGNDPNEVAEARRQEEIARAEALKAQLAAESARITVTDLFERWARTDLHRLKDEGKSVRRLFEKDVLPVIGHLRVEDVRKGHITAVTDALLARGVMRTAKMAFSLMRQMFRFAVERDILDNEPTSAIRKARIGGRMMERERVLSDDEIRTLHSLISSAALTQTTELAIWIALATCCRIGELLKAEWRHVRFDLGEWFIPAENSKNKRPHTIYLSEFAQHKFRALQAISGPTRWCLPNRSDSTHISEKTVTKQLGDRQRGDAGPMSHRSAHTSALVLPGGKWTPHDLRRTGATLMTALGVIPEVAEKCLNHTEQSSVKRTYQRYNYSSEMRDAWMRLGQHLAQLTA